jgi:esterase/lipase superfamily enzyme
VTQKYVLIPIFFGTDRIISGDLVPSQYFGNNRGTGTTLGICNVTVPFIHKYGEIERPSIFRLEFSEDPDKHFVLKSLEPKSTGDFYSELAKGVNGSTKKEALVFVHGFNVSFEEAAYRTAQMVYDLNFPGVAIMYSWPSHHSASTFGYTEDENEAAWALPHLQQFLVDVAAKSGANRIYIIGHSMGNSVLAQSLRSIQGQMAPGAGPMFNHVILAAPDIDSDIFRRDIAPNIQRVAGHITLYASSSDYALKFAKTHLVDGHDRAGDCSSGMCLVAGIDSIDGSTLSTDFPWHSAYGNALLADIYDLIENDLPPNKRPILVVHHGYIDYWAFPP